MRYFGYGNPRDGGINPPFPILDGKFRGCLATMGINPAVARLGYWPNESSVVTRYGLDTDIGGPTQYSGVPIHISLPVDEPFQQDSGVVKLAFYRSDGAPQTPSLNWRFFKVYTNVLGLTIPVTFVADTPFSSGTGDPTKDGEYRIIGDPAPLIRDAVVTSMTSLYYVDPNFTQKLVTIILNPSTDFAGVFPKDKVIIKIKNGRSFSTSILDPIPQSGDLIVGVDSVRKRIDVTLPDASWVLLSQAQSDGKVITVDIISSTKSGITGIQDTKLKNGELVIVPVAPLDKNARYIVDIELKTPSYLFEKTWEFSTNDN